VFLDRYRIVGATLDGGIVGHDHALQPVDTSDTGDQATGGDVVFTIHFKSGELPQLEKR
jgi:hypothetical protein